MTRELRVEDWLSSGTFDEHVAIDIRVKRGVGFNQVAGGSPPSRLNSRRQLQNELHRRAYRRSKNQVLTERGETGSRNSELIVVERNVVDFKLARLRRWLRCGPIR